MGFDAMGWREFVKAAAAVGLGDSVLATASAGENAGGRDAL